MSKFVINWDNEQTLADIRTICPPKVTKTEFDNFINQIKTIGANPFTREAYLLKYGDGPAVTIIGRDFYRRVAQCQVEYDYHHVDAVYSNDQFMVSDGEVKHKYDLTDRGRLMGAYCTIKRRSSSKTMYQFIEFAEYNQKKNMWTSKPATMIKKTAEQHALRMAFQGIFEGTYGQDEIDEEELKHEAEKQTSSPKSLNSTPEVSPMITGDQVDRIDSLVLLGNISPDSLHRAIKHFFKKDELHELTCVEADRIIKKLEEKVQDALNQENDANMEVKSTDETTTEDIEHKEIRTDRNTAHNDNHTIAEA